MTVPASVIVPLQGGRAQALRCLQALADQPAEPAFEVVVVDDAATGIGDLLDRLDGDVTVVRSERREGLAAAFARGARAARGEALVLMRGPAVAEPGWLAPLLGMLGNGGGAVSATAGVEHVVGAWCLALKAADSVAIDRAQGAADEHAIAAVLFALDFGATTVTASRVAAPKAHTTSARGLGGEPELSVVIPTLDATAPRVQRCIASVQRSTGSPVEIVIVDNGAPPQGFTAPVNAGLRAARAPYRVVMNDDVEVIDGWWQPLRGALEAGAAVAFPRTEGGPTRSDFAAWCFAIGAGAIDRHGYSADEFFDPAMRVWYQDTDLLTRLRAAGEPPVLVEESRIRHGLSETVASDDPELRAWVERTVADDRAAFLRKHPKANLQPVAIV